MTPSLAPPRARAPGRATMIVAALSGLAALAALAGALLLLTPLGEALALSAVSSTDLGVRLLGLALALGGGAAVVRLRRPAGSRLDATSAFTAEAPATSSVARAAPSDAQALDTLRRALVFQGASEATLATLAASAAPRRYRAGETLFHQGEPGDEALVVVAGSVDVLARAPAGGETVLATLGPGACVGEMAVLSEQPRTATVRARTDVVAYALSGAELRAAAQHDLGLAAWLGAYLEKLDDDPLASGRIWSARQALERCELFAEVSESTLEGLGRCAVPRRFRAGETVFQQGEAGDEALVLAYGRVDVLAANRRGVPVGLATLGPGACVGEMAVLSEQPRTATVRARTDVVAYALSGAELRAAARADAALAARLGGRIDRLAIDAFLKRSSPFARLPASAVWELSGQMRRRKLAAGETLVRQGEPASTFSLVVGGRLEVVRETRAGQEAPLATLGPGDCVGEAALIDERPRAATVRALEPTEVLELSREEFQRVVRQHQTVGAFFRELFLARYRHAPGQALAVPDPLSTLMPRLRESEARRVVGFLLGGLALLLALSLASVQTGQRPLLWLTLALGGLLPAVAYVAYVRERELLHDIPLRRLLGVSALAGGVGVPLAIVLQGLVAPSSVFLSALVVALVEEPLKLLPVFAALRERRYRFALDGVIFGVTAAMGFGGLESVGYGLLAFSHPWELCQSFDGPSCMVTTLWVRTASVFFGHGPWTAIVCAVLFRERGQAARPFTPAAGLAFGLAVLLHTLWDVSPALFGLPVAVVGLLALRRLMHEGLSHQAGALSALSLMSAGDRVAAGAHVTCLRCGTTFPASAIYCVRCGLALA